MLKITQISQANVKVTVQRTGKTYHRTLNYAKKVTKGEISKPKIDEFFLRKGRGWRMVNQKEYEDAISEESVREIQKQLSIQLRERVEREMKNNAVGA